MEIEYSNEERGKPAYRFTKWERQIIAQALPKEIKKIETKIRRIENNPRNEGQATYSMAIREHRMEIELLQDIVETFKD